MKQKKTGYVLVAALLLFNLHFMNGSAEGNESRWLMLKSEPTTAAWVSGEPVRFHAGEEYQQNHFRKVSQSLADDEEIIGEDGAGKGGMRGSAQLIEKIPQARSVMALKDKVMNKVSPVLENPDGRLFMPMFNSKNQNKMPRQEFSGSENFARPESDSKESGRSGPGQERYFVGYRLSSRANQQNENWYFGLGWKSGGGRGRRDAEDQESGDADRSRANILSGNKDQGQNVAKVEYSGPIVGLVGQF